ncbi:nitrilotriacetate monooxygenase component B [Halalkalibacter wakoensis JCM 9140]|uniref:Nitrilotriacetate monooxygenase component B n=1 Tax=Halalkalibacter wakoensis JCM 9140 TaxID=1236970 RepID=W4PZN6_9BACI|nr:nitrilotriacetate monooxygenase component B [Halalkalibacter wakoensis JCM 9140]
MKDTARNAIDIQEFVVHISDETYIEEINKTAKSLPPEESEVSITNLTPIDSLKINVPGIKEARVRLECRLERAIPLGGIDGEPTCDLLIGRIVQYHIQEDLYENGEINVNILKPVSRLAGNHYATLGKQFELKRPF